jgi:hypothetical protein
LFEFLKANFYTPCFLPGKFVASNLFRSITPYGHVNRKYPIALNTASQIAMLAPVPVFRSGDQVSGAELKK